MGGFHRYEREQAPNPENEAIPMLEPANRAENTLQRSTVDPTYGKPLHPLDHYDVAYFLSKGAVCIPRSEDLDDRSKNDWLAKSIILVQTSWFIAQSMGRLAQHLVLTELEIVTLAYTVVNIAIYVVWWKKPYQVKEPVAVYGQLPEMTLQQWRVKMKSEENAMIRAFSYAIGIQDDHMDLRCLKGTPAFYSGDTDSNGVIFALSMTLFCIVGALFGAVHFLGWSSSFPTRTLQLLWRISAIGLTGVPIALPATLIGGALVTPTYASKILAIPLAILFISPMPLFPVFYLFGRVTTLVLAFMTLKTLPPSAYRAVEWSDLVPHI